MPLAIINTAVKTKTTRAMPSIVMTVVSRRDDELRRTYLIGICIAHSAHMPQAIDDARGEDSPGRNHGRDQAHEQPRSAPEQNRFRFQIEYRKPSFGKRSLKTVKRGQGHAQTEGAAQDRENKGLAGAEEKQLVTGKA